jgi:hypothetical protein
VNWQEWSIELKATIVGGTTNQSSPILSLVGQVWSSVGPSSIVDTWHIQDVITNVTDGASTLTLSHTGSTGLAAVSVPMLQLGQGSSDVGISRLGAASLAVGNGTAGGITGQLTLGSAVMTAAAPTVAASQVGFGGTVAATANTTGGGLTLPLLAAGYLVINVAGTQYKVPYYAN